MSSIFGPWIAGKAAAQRGHDRDRVVDRQGGLRRVGEVRRIGHLQPLGLRHVLDQQHRAFGKLAHRADHLGMAGMADQDHGAARIVMRSASRWTLEHQRARRVDIEKLAPCGFVRHRLGHAVRREDDRPVVRHLVELVDEDRALGLQTLDHEAIVHDLVADIDRPAVALDRALDDLDRAVDAGAEAAWAGQQDR
jgi:hypothetical protein